MNWTELLKREVDEAYRAAIGLITLVDDSELEWKPATGENWMTVGRLLKHMTTACGACCKGVLTGDWGFVEEDMGGSPEDMLPPAEKLPTSSSKAEALAELEADRTLALQMIDQAGEETLDTKHVDLPWGSSGTVGYHFLDMIGHLKNHKSQLFYYLKLLGRPVNTHHFYGMPTE